MKQELIERFARTILDLNGHLASFTLEVDENDAEAVRTTLQSLGCSVSSSGKEPGKLLICQPGVEGSLLDDPPFRHDSSSALA